MSPLAYVLGQEANTMTLLTLQHGNVRTQIRIKKDSLLLSKNLRMILGYKLLAPAQHQLFSPV